MQVLAQSAGCAVRPRALGSLCLCVALFFAAVSVPALAQTPTPEISAAPALDENVTPLSSLELLTAVRDICVDLGSGGEDAYQRALDNGWVPYDDEESQPLKSVFAGSRTFAGFGQAELWSSVETYPSLRLGYCRISLVDENNAIAFSDVGGLGLEGTYNSTDDGVSFGSWQSADQRLLAIAARVAQEFEIEFNLVLPLAPPTTPSVAPPPDQTQL